MSGRWTISSRSRPDGGTVWLVGDEQDAGRPVAEFSDRAAAQAHVDRLEQGPFDLDEQDRREREADDAWGAPDQRIPWNGGDGEGRGT